jgi:integrase
VTPASLARFEPSAGLLRCPWSERWTSCDLAEAIDPRFRALVLVAAYAGLRWGELVGLRVKRVDLLHGRITVAEQATELDGRFTWGPPKTEAGRRTMTLPAVAAAALAGHLGTHGRPGPDKSLRG